MSFAAETVGHREGGRDPVRRNEPELAGSARVPAARDDYGSETVECRAAGVPVGEGQPRVAGAADAVGLERTRIGRRCTLGLGERRRGPARAGRLEERAVRLLRRVGVPAPEGCDEDHGSALTHGEGVPPEPERVAEADRRCGERVRAFPREGERRPRDADAEGVERLVEDGAAALDAADERLGVRHGRRPAERRRGGLLDRHRREHAHAQGARHQPESAGEAGAGDPVHGGRLIREAA